MSDTELSEARAEIDREIARLKQDTDQFKSDVLGVESAENGNASAEQRQESLNDKIAAHPELELPSSADELRSNSSSNSKGKSDPSDNASSKQSESTLASRLDENKVPVSWVAQIATFQKWGNAEKLLNELLEDNYRAFLRPSSKDDAGPYVLLVGPTFDRAQSADISQEISEAFNTGEPLLRRFSSGMR